MAAKCECCKNLDSNDSIYGKKWATGLVFEHSYLRIADIIEKGRQGCRYCSLLINILDECISTWPSRIEELSLYVLAPDDRPFEIIIEEAPRPDAEMKDLASVSLSAPEGIDIPCLRLGGARLLAQNSANAVCLEFIQDRLRTCYSHNDCAAPTRTLLPKRVINIGSENNGIRLYEADGDVEFYAALSYCWGKNSVLLKTTHTTLEAFKREVPWQRIPRTIQDTIIIARELGLTYIWVDSLCIVQDSQLDWETEAAKMGQYYQNAFITIAASCSQTAESGIFNNRPTVSPPKTIRFTGEDMQDYPIVIQTRTAKRWPSTIHELGLLADRAWTFQEHGLSTRMIHFTDDEIVWECQSAMISENGHPIKDNNHGLIREIRQLIIEDPETTWRFCVGAYSHRAITVLDDKLPAIAGIASWFQRQTNYCYLAGMWKETILIDLVWSSWGWEDFDKPPSILRAPSWSWASIHGGVAFAVESVQRGIHVKTHCIVENYRYTVEGNNPFGQVAEGILDITGPLLEMDIDFTGDLDDFGLPSYKLTQGDISVPVFSPDTSLRSIEVKDGEFSKLWTVQRTSVAPVALHAKVWCLWCLTTSQEPSELQQWFNEEPMNLHGIVLAKLTSSPMTYTRIGSACARGDKLLDMASRRTLSIK